MEAYTWTEMKRPGAVRLGLLLNLALAVAAHAQGRGTPGRVTLPEAPVGVVAAPLSAAAPLAAPISPVAQSLVLPAAVQPLAAGAAHSPALPLVKVEKPGVAGLATAEPLARVRGRPHGLDRRFQELRRAFGRPAEEPLPDSGATARLQAERLRHAVFSQLEAMRAEVGDDEVLAQVAADAKPLLDQIEGHLLSGAIDPSVRLRYSESDPVAAPAGRPIRVGVYPVAADPFQWAHLLIGLQAIARLELDQVVFVLAGDDPRKPNMTPAAVRHPMGRAALDRFSPFFAYSDLAVGTLYDGETNIYRFLALNPGVDLVAYYMVGDDHYRLVDKKGNPDTLPKLEANGTRLPYDARRHLVRVAFNEREGRGEEVPTSLDVSFLPRMSFDASSTLVRGGRHALMPHASYDHVRRTGAGLYGIAPKD